ncbi:conserved hypothetical protein [Xanthomonas citri pv. mangiferaeindicae LMG 941]|nr:conserved hypothetical protein [Xanthomonas citri pv. mangiferaeindicae LMG 941]
MGALQAFSSCRSGCSGPFAGAWLGEYYQARKSGQATKVGIGTWVGIMLGTATKLALGLCMLGAFAIGWFF